MQANEANALTLDALVHNYYPAVVRLALSILSTDGSPAALDEAEDAAQETFIAAANALSGFHGASSPKTWLFAIAINACRSRLRRRKAQRALAQTLAHLQRLFGQGAPVDGAQSAEQAVEVAERDRVLWAAVDSLDEKHRLVVLLRYVHELPVAEIAQALEISEGTVYSRLHYARQFLARRLRRSLVFQEVGTR